MSTTGPSRSGSNPYKRRRTKAGGLFGVTGGSAKDWQELVADSALSTSSASRRTPRPKALPTLASCCVRSFTRTFRYEYGGHRRPGEPLEADMTPRERFTRERDVADRRAYIRQELKLLPPYLREKVYKRLRIDRPDILSLDLLTQVLGDEREIDLQGNILPAVTQVSSMVSLNISRPAEVTSFVFTDNMKATDNVIAAQIAKMTGLKKLVLRNCSQVGKQTVKQIVKLADTLTYVNLSGTAIDAADLLDIVESCRELEVLKVADNTKLSASKNRKIWDQILGLAAGVEPDPAAVARPLSKLKSLKVRASLPQPAGPLISKIFRVLPDLTSLDISQSMPQGTIAHSIMEPVPRFIKLKAAGTALRDDDLQALLEASCDVLHSLAFTLPRSNRNVYRTRPGEACTALRKLHIERFNMDTVWMEREDVFAAMGKTLTHFSIPGGTDVDFMFSTGIFDEASPLQELDLSGSNVNDRSAPVIAQLQELEVLDLSCTQITDEGVFTILSGCPMLHTIDLTSCRGVPVAQRRNIFKAYEEHKREQTEAAAAADGDGHRPKKRRRG